MNFSSAPGKLYDVPQVLKQGIAVNAHDRKHSQGEQGHGHDDDFYGAGDREPHQFRVARQNQQEPSLDRVSQFQHTAENLAGISVPCNW